jgi:RimJ/RimL family protein N-acetyltransferase
MTRSQQRVDVTSVPRFTFVGLVVRLHRRLLTSAGVTVALFGVWLYVRNHHVVIDVLTEAGYTRLDCGTWSDRTYAHSDCFEAFGGFDDVLYLVATVGTTSAALFLALILLNTLWRPPVYARGRNVVLRSIGPRDARALAATIDADVIVENRLPFNAAYTLRRVARWHTVPSHVAICATDTGSLVGGITLTADLKEMQANLGLWIGSHHRGKGYATDALTIYAPMLHDRGFSKVIVETAVDNRAMRTALEHAGFESAGNFTFTFPSGESISAVRYISVAKSEPGGTATNSADPLDSDLLDPQA